MKLAGARILLECLAREGVDTLFGNAAGFIAPVREALTHCPARTVRLDRAEAVIHAADGYARATGRVGVAFAGSGLEALHTVAGIATALRDASALVVFFFRSASISETLEDSDLSGVVRPCAKHTCMVRSAEDLPRQVRQALYLARSGRPGPVVVDMSEILLTTEATFDWPEKITLRGYNPPAKPHRNQLRRAVDELDRAARPLICVGGGAAGAAQEITKLAKSCGIPVVSTLMGLGVFPGDDPLWLGMAGLCGTDAANTTACNADVILAVGMRFDPRTLHSGRPVLSGRSGYSHAQTDYFGHAANVIHLDMDPAADRTDINVNVPVPGDCRLSMECLAELLEKFAPHASAEWPVRRAGWLAQTADWKLEAERKQDQPRQGGERLTTLEVMDALNRLVRPDAVFTTGAGRHQMATATGRLFREPRTLLTPGGFGPVSRGTDFGLTAAMGAQCAFPQRQVIHVTGDAAFIRSLPDVEALTRLLLPVRVLVLDNREPDPANPSCAPDLAKLAEGFRLETLKAQRKEDLMQTLKRAFATTGPVAVIIPVEPDAPIVDVPVIPKVTEEAETAGGPPLSLS